jgi:hypothetical protein
MNQDKKLLVKSNIENIINDIRTSTYEKYKIIDIPKNILLDYYNLITSIISDQSLTIYLLHIISREINNSSSIEKELLLSLLPQFYVPFMNADISLTDPYLSRILTSLQSNILSDISPLYIAEIYKKIIINIFKGDEDFNVNISMINKDLFEICHGFCLYNMKLNQYNNQLCGIACLNFLLNEIDFSFLNINNYVLYIWEKVELFLNSKEFAPKEYLLKYLYDLISKFKIPFKPYVNLAIYIILGFIDDKNSNTRKNALNVLSLIISFYPNEIIPIKESIIQLLKILQNDEDENIRNKATYIYSKFDKQYTTLTINHKTNDKSLYFYYLGKSNKSNKENTNVETENSNRFSYRRIEAPKYINNINNNIDDKNISIKRESDVGGIIDYKQNSYKCIFENGKNYLVEKKNDLNENKRYYENYTTKSNINKFNYLNDINEDNEIGFRELLNIVKKNCGNKCILNNNFSNLRDEINKNNGLKQINRIKGEKVIKTE